MKKVVQKVIAFIMVIVYSFVSTPIYANTDITNMTLSMVKGASETEVNINSIKNLEGGKANSHLVRFNPPSGSNKGDANFYFTLDTPKGRGDIEILLKIYFSSYSGNGVLGKGFSLSGISRITTDTRNGVPNYDENDTYMLDGVLLEEKGRCDKYIEYSLLREKDYKRIRRYNERTDNEYWSVEEKNGIKREYGKGETSKVCDGNKVGEWHVTRESDRFGNSIEYEYIKDRNMVYISNINYTGYNGRRGAYDIKFSYKERDDVQNTYRYGYEKAVGLLLSEIMSSYKGEIIKKYSFLYTTEYSLNGCNMLKEFVVENADKENYSYAFEYTPIERDESGRVILFGKPILYENSRGIETSKGRSKGTNFTAVAGGGVGGSLVDVHASIGGSGSFESGIHYSEDTLVDIDGDGLVDSVWQDEDGEIYYAKNTGKGFGKPISLMNTDTKINYDASSTSSIGFNAYAGVGMAVSILNLEAGYNYSKVKQNSTTDTLSSFMDIDGDGRCDFLISGKNIYFHNDSTNKDGSINFSTRSLYRGENDRVESVKRELTEEEKREYEELYASLTPFKMWRAPYSGVINIKKKTKGIGKNFKSDNKITSETYIRDEKKRANLSIKVTKEESEREERNITIRESDHIYFINVYDNEPRYTDIEEEIEISYDKLKVFNLHLPPYVEKEIIYPTSFKESEFREYFDNVKENDNNEEDKRAEYYKKFASSFVKNTSTNTFDLNLKNEEIKEFYSKYPIDSKTVAKALKIYNRDNESVEFRDNGVQYYKESSFTMQGDRNNGTLGSVYYKENGDIYVNGVYIEEKGVKEPLSFNSSVISNGNWRVKSYKEESNKDIKTIIETLNDEGGILGECVIILCEFEEDSMELNETEKRILDKLLEEFNTKTVSYYEKKGDRYYIKEIWKTLLSEGEYKKQSEYNRGYKSYVKEYNMLLENREKLNIGRYKRASVRFNYNSDYLYKIEDGIFKTYSIFSDTIKIESALVRASWNNVQDYSNENNNSEFLVYEYSEKIETNDKEKNENEIEEVTEVYNEIKIYSDEFLYGGVNGWYYGIFQKSTEKLLKGKSFERVLTEFKMDENGSKNEKKLEEEIKNNKMTENDSGKVHHILPTKNEKRQIESGEKNDIDKNDVEECDNLPALSNIDVDISLMDEEAYLASLVGPVVKEEKGGKENYYMPFIYKGIIHSQRNGGNTYYSIEGLNENEKEEMGEEIVMPAIRRTFGEGIDTVSSLSFKVGDFFSLGFSLPNNEEGVLKAFNMGCGAFSGNGTTTTTYNGSVQNFLDMNGDGIPDLVEINNKKLSVFPLIKKNNKLSFKKPLTFMNDIEYISRTKNMVNTVGAGVNIQGTVKSRPITDRRGNVREEIVLQASPGSGMSVLYSQGKSKQATGLYDINGDGLIDYYDGSVFRLSNGKEFLTAEKSDGKFISAITPSLCETLSFGVNFRLGYGADLMKGNTLRTTFSLNGGIMYSSSSTVQEEMLLDINGDGKVDLVKMTKGDDYLSVRFNKGESFSSEEKVYVPLWNKVIKDNEEIFLRLKDNNGFDLGFIGSVPLLGTFTKGITDTVAINPFGFNPKLYANSLSWKESITLGVSGNAGMNIHIGIWFFATFHITASVGAGSQATSSINGTSVSMIDLDGDGYIDHVMRIPGCATYYKKNLSGRYGELVGITLPEGGKIGIDYMDKQGTIDDPHFKRVMSKVSYNNDEMECLYEYEDAYYDRIRKEEYGFERVVSYIGFDNTNDTYITKTINTYYNKEYYSYGLENSVITYDNNDNKLNEIINFIDNKPYSRMLETRKVKYEILSVDKAITTFSQYTYDEIGNVVHLIENYDCKRRTTSDIVYDNTNIEDYIVGLPINITINDSSSKLARYREGKYDSKGNLIELLQYYEKNKFTKTSFEYDEWGNIISVIEPSGVKKTYVYDAETNTLPIEINTIASDNSDRLTYNIEYDIKLQKKKKETSPNGDYFKYNYDAWGRLVSLYTTYDNENATPSVEYEYHTQKNSKWYCITKNKVSFDSNDDKTIRTVVELDDLGRVMRSSKSDIVYKDGVKIKGWSVNEIKVYDKAGRVSKDGCTYFIEGEDISSLLIDDVKTPTFYIRYDYDAENRLIKITLPDESVKTIEYRIDSGLYYIKVIDDLGNITETVKDSRDCIIKIQKYDKENTLLTFTSYTYTDMKELVSVKDAKGNETKAVYDLLGRRTLLSTPDSGISTWEYDESGRMKSESNSVLQENNQNITYEYDSLGRIYKKIYPNLRETVYTYGNSREKAYAGRVKRIEDSSGVIEYEYGHLGEITKETRSLFSHLGYYDIGDKLIKSFLYKSNYLGQIEEINFPDNEKIIYTYNESGDVVSLKSERHNGHKNVITEYIKDIGYDEYGNRVYIEYGNGVKTNYKYDDKRRWLKGVRTENNSGKVLQDINYSFDTVGNVLSYTNNCLSLGGSKVKQEYEYDGLYQLISASGVYEKLSQEGVIDWTESYTQKYTYDIIGNITHKSSATSGSRGYDWYSDLLNYNFDYIYKQSYAHRLDNADGRYYKYDANGNITALSDTTFEKEKDYTPHRLDGTSWYVNYDITTPDRAPEKERKYKEQRDMEYDDRGQMSSSVGTDEKQVLYYYDENGKRTNKHIQSESELFTYNDMYSVLINRYNRSEGGQVQKQLMLGNTRVVSKIDLGSFNATEDWYNEHTFYYHSDHLGSATIITDQKGEVYQVTEYTPYGERWLEKTDNKFNDNYLPYRFTGKPLDDETGYYYFGARYYDARRSLWTTSDPAMNSYFDDISKGDGGVLNAINLNTYHYAGNNPVKYIDPNGSDIVQHELYALSIGCMFATRISFGIAVDSERNIAIYTKREYGIGFGGGLYNFDLPQKVGDFLTKPEIVKNITNLITGINDWPLDTGKGNLSNNKATTESFEKWDGNIPCVGIFLVGAESDKNGKLSLKLGAETFAGVFLKENVNYWMIHKNDDIVYSSTNQE